MVRELRGELLTPNIDVGRVTNLLGEQHNIDQFALLEHIARVGAPVDVGPGGNLDRELACGNNNSADKHANEVWEKAVGDVTTGRAIVNSARLAGMVRGLRINPVRGRREKEEDYNPRFDI